MIAHINIVNLTPHVLNIVKEDGSVVSVMPSGRIMRVSSEYKLGSCFGGIPLYSVKYGPVELVDSNAGQPIPMDSVDWVGANHYYVVSGICLEAIRSPLERELGRLPHVMFCAPGELVRDSEGKPIGCKGLRV